MDCKSSIPLKKTVKTDQTRAGLRLHGVDTSGSVQHWISVVMLKRDSSRCSEEDWLTLYKESGSFSGRSNDMVGLIRSVDMQILLSTHI